MKKIISANTISYVDRIDRNQKVELLRFQEMHSNGEEAIRDVIRVTDKNHSCWWVRNGKGVGILELSIHPKEKFIEAMAKEVNLDIDGNFVSEKEAHITLDKQVAKQFYEQLKKVFEA